jgi:hypothetical protein
MIIKKTSFYKKNNMIVPKIRKSYAFKINFLRTFTRIKNFNNYALKGEPGYLAKLLNLNKIKFPERLSSDKDYIVRAQLEKLNSVDQTLQKVLAKNTSNYSKQKELENLAFSLPSRIASIRYDLPPSIGKVVEELDCYFTSKADLHDHDPRI